MPTPNYPHFLRALRAHCGLTQEKLAERLGVSFPTINRWENGHAVPSPLALRQIASLIAEMGPEAAALLASLREQPAEPPRGGA
jgi:putative transcriptional regulator